MRERVLAEHDCGSREVTPLQRFSRALIKMPIHVYRWTFKPFTGAYCRHLPTCSEYGLEAIEQNGAWKGAWLTLSRVLRCHPWGSSGYDPVPDIGDEHHRLAPWRYGRWRGPKCRDDASGGA